METIYNKYIIYKFNYLVCAYSAHAVVSQRGHYHFLQLSEPNSGAILGSHDPPQIALINVLKIFNLGFFFIVATIWLPQTATGHRDVTY